MLKKPILPEWRYWPGVMLAVLFAVAVYGAASSRISPPREPAHASEQQKAADTSKDEKPSNFFAIGAFLSDPRKSSAIEAIATVLLAVVTGILVWVAYRQFTTTRAQLRAYVHLEKINVEDASVNRIPKASFVVKNFGVTPAREVRVDAAIFVAPYPLDRDLPDRDYSVAHRTLPPGDTFRIVEMAKRALDNDEIVAVHAGRYAIYVVGAIGYRDIFREERITEFCVFCNKRTGLTIAGNGNVAAYPGGYHDT